MNPKLYIVVESGNVDVLVQIINQIADEVTPNKNTVLHLASQFGKIECVNVILSRHPSLFHQVNSSGESALHVAARNGHYDVVVALLGCAASLDESEPQVGGVGRVKEMLRMRNEEGDTALHDAVRYHQLDVVKYILQEDSEFSYTANISGETPLYIAARRGYYDLVAVILELCQSPPPPYDGPDGSTALHGAVIFRSQGCTEKLVDWNKSLVMKRDENGYSPLHYDALFGDYPYMASQLLDADTSVAYLVDNDKNTALHIGVSRGDYPLARKLILSCPDCCEMVNGRGQNILHIALENNDDFMVECILENCRGISSLMTQKDEDGNTPLHLMAASNLKVRELIKHAMTDKAALNKQHFTPLDMVAEEHGDLWWALKNAKSKSSLQKVMSSRQDKRKRTTEKEDWAAEEKERLAEIRKTFDVNMIVAALIATVTFAAGFTIPGGYNQSGTTSPVPGMAVLSQEPAFQAFMVSDTVALLLSCVAIFLNFWGSWMDTVETIEKFAIVTTLFVTAAIVAMIVAFSTATYAVLAQSSALAIATCVVGVISIPISFLLCFKLGRVSL